MMAAYEEMLAVAAAFLHKHGGVAEVKKHIKVDKVAWQASPRSESWYAHPQSADPEKSRKNRSCQTRR